MKFRRLNQCLLAIVTILLVVALSGPASAQLAPGKLHGQIMDPTEAVVPQANISVKNASGLSLSVKSDGAGGYEVKNLTPGAYTLTVTAKGFVPATLNIVIAAGQDQKLNIPLEVAGKEEEITVESESSKVSTNSDSNANAVVISGKDLDALSDDPDELQSELQALAGPSAGPNGGQIYIDGFTGGQLPPKSSIREIRINQNPFSAQYDRMGFGRIEILTKPGTDKIHGQVSYNDNHSVFDALNPFAASEPDFSSEIVNANVGGPLNKKASYFLNFERRNINDAAVVSASAFNAAGIPIVPVLNPRVRTNVSGRLDYQVSASNTLTARYQFTKNHEENNGISQLSLPSQAFNQDLNEHTLQISDTQVIGSRAVNETRFEYQHNDTDLNSLSALPGINVLGTFTGGGNGIGVSSVIDRHYELQNYTSLTTGKHFLRFGGRLRATSESNLSSQGFNGAFTFASTPDPTDPSHVRQLTALQAFSQGLPSQFTLTRGSPQISNTFIDAGLYAEDDFKVRQNMTLSYGLRFETQNGISDHGDWAPRVGFAWGLGGKKNAQPKTIVRAGFGVFYDRFGQSPILQTLRLNGLNQQQFTVSIDPNNPAATQSELQGFFSTYPVLPTIGLIPSRVTTFSIAPDLRAPYTVQAAASVERQLSKSSTLTVNYIHSQGVHQFLNINCQATGVCAALDAPALPVGATAGPQFVYLSEGIFKQNQLITSYNMRLGAKITIFSYYSLSYANGDASGTGSTPSNPVRGITADYGRTSFDVRNRLFLGGTVALKHGFRLSPFMVANSGPPFNITLGQDLNGDSIFNDRPSLASAGAANTFATNFGNFNTQPGPNDPRIPINFGATPAQFTLNLRASKTFGIGPKTEAAANAQQQGGGRGGPGGGREGGRGPGGPGPGARGPGGPMGGIFGGERSDRKYSLTFSANARNLFNTVNAGIPVGSLSAGRQFGIANSLAGGVFNTQSANRRIDFQTVFTF